MANNNNNNRNDEVTIALDEYILIPKSRISFSETKLPLKVN